MPQSITTAPGENKIVEIIQGLPLTVKVLIFMALAVQVGLFAFWGRAVIYEIWPDGHEKTMKDLDKLEKKVLMGKDA
eukprot:CAMPEP_0172504542 /NCGR_PEP_ID=MMETSP1066-20121228/179640_1 /TAXON_ID=671091 /ORGANISM="Coscinodiscus wailesii, Strain CCMP2513" /LENGTH=76 /DNA_ID=CAMNT_0013280771 /DNA_START=234 /DNA_END=464 /DNA_ORIENTATION=+